jgi:hypothetical protein
MFGTAIRASVWAPLEASLLGEVLRLRAVWAALEVLLLGEE